MALDDPHIQTEVLANITEGAVMGAIIGLKGPSATAKAANMSRSRDRETRGRREQDTRMVQAEHAFLVQIMMIIKACQGFVVMTASARNVIWQFHSVRTFISALKLTEFDVHSCRWLGRHCFSLRIATNLEIAIGGLSTHIAECDKAIATSPS